MWFKIQKSTFTKLYYYYLRNLRNSLWVLAVNAVLMLLFFFSTKNLGTEGINAFISGFGSKISSTNYYQLFLFLSFNLTVSYLGLLIFLYLATRRLNGNIGGFLRSKRSQAEESCILLFACPINRQTIIAAKLAAFATYWGGVRLVGLVIPTCLILALNTQLSFLAILSFFFLSGFFLSLVDFCWLALPALYNGVVSGKKFIFICLYLFFAMLAHGLIYFFLPLWGSPPLFLASFLAGGYFAWQYWKGFQDQDLV